MSRSWKSRGAPVAKGKPPVVRAEAFVGFAAGLREALFALQQPGDNEIEREALAANALATRYTVCCHELLLRLFDHVLHLSLQLIVENLLFHDRA